MILTDNSILISLEGSIPREVNSCGTNDGGVNIAGGTCRSWEENRKGLLQESQILNVCDHAIQLTGFWHFNYNIVSKWSQSNCSCCNTAVVGVVRMQRWYCEPCLSYFKLLSLSTEDSSYIDCVSPDYAIPVLLCWWPPDKYKCPCIRWSCYQTLWWSTGNCERYVYNYKQESITH